jgi:hypothetical protein
LNEASSSPPVVPLHSSNEGDDVEQVDGEQHVTIASQAEVEDQLAELRQRIEGTKAVVQQIDR